MSTPNFEQMSNDELRQQMENFGLPKVPITASTRNILIKRLQNHVNGTPGKATTTKARRETMHVVKYSSDDDSDRDAAKEKLKKKMENHKNARRQTINVAASQPIQPVAVPAAVEKASRKSMRATPTKSVPRESSSGIVPPIKVKATVPVTIEDSDEEEEVIAAPRRQPSVDRRSKSKTPSKLGKSDLVTTSYKHVVAPVQEEPIEVDDEEEEEERNSDLEENLPLGPRYASRHFAVTDPMLSKYSPVKPMSIRISPLRYSASSSAYRKEEATAPAPSSIYTRPSLATSSAYTSKYSSASPVQKGGLGEDVEEFPYLREFSKRLSTLKAEPLYKRNVPMSSSSTLTRSSTTYSARTSNLRPVIRRETHWYDPINSFLVRLEEKYALKNKILILLAVLVVIFLVVMFWY